MNTFILNMRLIVCILCVFAGTVGTNAGFFPVHQVLLTDTSVNTTALFSEAYQYYLKGEYRQAEDIYRKIMETASGKDKTWTQAECYRALGMIQERNGNYNDANHFYNRSLILMKKKFGNDSYRLISIYLNMGILNRVTGNYSNSLHYYNLAEALHIKNSQKKGVTHKSLGRIFVNKGVVFKTIGEYHKALEYYKKALKIYLSAYGKDHVCTGKLFENMGLVYYMLRDYETALEYFLKTLPIYYKSMHNNIPKLHFNIAKVYYAKKDSNNAEKYFQSSIELYKKNADSNDIELAYVYYHYGYFHMKDHLNSISLKYINKGIRKSSHIFLHSHPVIAAGYVFKGNYYLFRHSPDSALINYQRALHHLIKGYDNPDYNDFPELKNYNSEIHLLYTLKQKARAFRMKYTQTHKPEALEAGMEAYNLAFTLIDKMRCSYTSRESKLFLTEKEDNIYAEAVGVALELYSSTHQSEYKHKAFEYAERNRSAILLSSLKDMKDKKPGNIPDELLEYENHLKHQLSACKTRMYNEDGSEIRASVQHDRWEDSVFELNRKYDKLIAHFEEKYPGYYALKYRSDYASPELVRSQIQKDEAFIEYLVADTLIYAFLITRDVFTIKTIAVETDFISKVLKFRSLLTDYENIIKGNAGNDISQYTEIAYALYKKLIHPLEKNIRNKRLIIVPDNQLAYIPFEALIYKLPGQGSMRYNKLDYLVRRHAISYTYSGSLKYNDYTRYNARSVKEKRLAAFSPVYNRTQKNPDRENLLAIRNIRDYLGPIPGVNEEVKHISRLINTKIFDGSQATEDNFKQVCRDFDIIHLAMHTLIDDSLPMYSKLAFNVPQDDREDGFLNTFEVYNMQLNARLVVLSACNTGYGTISKGEGVMSLARGFLNAGCPSLIMTLWAVEDKTSADLIHWFYIFLKEGKTKDEALQEAKLHYLDKADLVRSHPYFWTGYVNIGDTQAMFSGKNSRYYIMLITLAALVMILAFALIQRRKNRIRAAKK